ncbi:hypothetical protein QN400_19415 [Pseudomonas sp. RTC3]|jgi:hypothetical protein|uniref:hypothetical protein n=1 Tax=unclassified Pseudomonas TaxID=196821 RepID=UPI002AB4B705|nr:MULTISPECIES: hypothetical protein [unclassified Pseudomonas]MEB0064184.1 hypothetical protein [Pseudomonas sp. RTC3]MDY7566182.1 hypothetical protein [Pseudomonas sp. 5C2]MEB0005682.1 hypothetical protein [Pseudomonas sp. RTB2]MEB0019970.1 hypothetical protein [Pseudomonas sp. RTB3]MEB0024681.1 hypothetical protein [Pseudomonas sp. MH9.2]
MTLLKDYHDTQKALEQQLSLLASLKKNSSLIKELEFEKKIKALMTRYRKTPKDLITLFDTTAPLTNTTVHERPVTYATGAKRLKKTPESKPQ